MTNTKRRLKDGKEKTNKESGIEWDEPPYVETILLHTVSETVIIGKEVRGNCQARPGKYEKGSGPWTADWAGCLGVKGFGINGYSRIDVVTKIEQMIRTRKSIFAVREECYKICAARDLLKNTRGN
jgi:hypothetical protein